MASKLVGEIEMSDGKHSTHKNPIWGSRADFIISSELPEPGRFEQLWCRQLTEGSFEVCCIPFFLYDVALGDVISAEDNGGTWLMKAVTEPSGRYVFRAHFEGLGNRERTAAALAELGALVEWSSPSLIAVDAHDASLGQKVADFLFACELEGELIYEAGKS